jgi:hypothetical protein
MIILSPASAADTVCHDEQLRIWAAHDNIIGALALGDFLRDDLSYDEALDLEQAIMSELKSIIHMAFDHPEAKTIKRR